MVNLIARRAIYRTRAGGSLRVTKQEAVVLKALGLADEAPATQPYAAPAKKTKAGAYKRRDLVAEAPAAAIDPVLTEFQAPRVKRWTED